MDANSFLFVFLLVNVVAFSQLDLAVQAAESVPVPLSDSIHFHSISNELKVLSRRTRPLTPPSPRINAPLHNKPRSPPPLRPPPPPPPPPPCLWQPPM
ncbi:hypothetical protein V6N13_140713 [Hibiscus sabdariffa]|uniref:Uncharacterized protein n=1 Tax=Hibiscus sabdariffa TaxID=183260 RepID=A0ABR2Q2G2_9ROSI